MSGGVPPPSTSASVVARITSSNATHFSVVNPVVFPARTIVSNPVPVNEMIRTRFWLDQIYQKGNCVAREF